MNKYYCLILILFASCTGVQEESKDICEEETQLDTSRIDYISFVKDSITVRLNERQQKSFVNAWSRWEKQGMYKDRSSCQFVLAYKDSIVREFWVTNGGLVKENGDCVFAVLDTSFIENLYQEISYDNMYWKYKTGSVEDVEGLIENPCNNVDLELEDLYPVQDTIPNDSIENLILEGKLKEKGYNVIRSGRGNWQHGPRAVSHTLQNGNCECRVDKLYYDMEQEGKYKVTERIACKLLEY